MPTYEYECSACGHAFEFLQSMTDKKLEKCPQCSRKKLVRLIGSGTGIIFKGSGFYETDYKKKTPSNSESSNAPSAASVPKCAGNPGSCACAGAPK